MVVAKEKQDAGSTTQTPKSCRQNTNESLGAGTNTRRTVDSLQML